MKLNKLFLTVAAISTISLSANAVAKDPQFTKEGATFIEAGMYLGGGISSSGVVRLQSEVASGGYTFLEGKTETVEPYTAYGASLGLGIIDFFDTDVTTTRLNLEVGYIFENIKAEAEDFPADLDPAPDLDVKHRGLIYAFGAETKLKDYDDYGFLLEVRHLGSSQVLETDTLIGVGMSYIYEGFKFKAKYYQEGWGQLSVSYFY